MLELEDRVELPPGVRREPGALCDEVRGARFPLNETAEALLDGCGRPLGAAASALAARYAIPGETARADVLRFAAALNRHGLANVRRGTPLRRRAPAWAACAARVLPLGRLPEAALERRALDTRTVGAALTSAVRGLARSAVVVALAVLVVLLAVVSAGGAAALGTAVLVAASAGAAVVLHEAGHAVALRGVPAALLLVRGRASVLHAPLSRRRSALVALAGPALPALAGVLLALVALHCGTAALGLAACPPAGHALSASVATRDGRIACDLAPLSGGRG